jgi:glycine hydroxymethyltransferase
MQFLPQLDPQVAKIIRDEERRQSSTLEMIASENHASAAVLEAMGTVLTDKYAEGYPRRRWYNGCENVDAIEQLAIDRARELFGADHANVQPHSGTSANLAVYVAALKPGQKILGMRLDQGGHLSHGLEINLSGMCYKAVHYGVDQSSERLDMDQVRQRALEERPNLIVVGASAYPRVIDFAAFEDIAREVGCPVLADIAHIAGLVVGGVHPSPVPHADFVTTTTHKTLRGPRSGLIMCRANWARKIDSAVFPGIQGGPLAHVMAAKAVAFGECLAPAFKQYAADVVANCRALADELMALGLRLVSGGTDNHLLLIDLRSKSAELSGRTAANWLAAAGIVANKNTIPFDPRPPIEGTGIRLGTPALTTRGMKAQQMRQVARLVDAVLSSGGDEGKLANARAAVGELAAAFPIPKTR